MNFGNKKIVFESPYKGYKFQCQTQKHYTHVRFIVIRIRASRPLWIYIALQLQCHCLKSSHRTRSSSVIINSMSNYNGGICFTYSSICFAYSWALLLAFRFGAYCTQLPTVSKALIVSEKAPIVSKEAPIVWEKLPKTIVITETQLKAGSFQLWAKSCSQIAGSCCKCSDVKENGSPSFIVKMDTPQACNASPHVPHTSTTGALLLADPTP